VFGILHSAIEKQVRWRTKNKFKPVIDETATVFLYFS